MPKVILLSYYFPPVKAIGSIRNLNIAQQFAKNYDDVIVFSSSLDVLEQNWKGIGIKPYDIKHLLSQKSTNGGKKSAITSSSNLKTKLMNSFPLSLILGEGGLIYSIRILKKLWKYRKDDVILYSSYRPIADHHIAYIFKLISKNTFWIADYRDVLFDKDVLDVFLPGFQEKLYSRLTKKADILTTVSKGLAAFFETYNDNIFVLRNGVENSANAVAADSLVNKDKFNISYTGALYKGRRDPSVLFRALRSLLDKHPRFESQIELHYAGREGGLWNDFVDQFGLSKINNCHNLVTRDQSLLLQKESNINLLLSWCSPNNQGILTGKFFEYLKAKNPIITLISGDQDIEFEEIFSKDNIGILAYNSQVEKIEEYLLVLYNSWMSNDYQQHLIDDRVVNSYNWDNTFIEFYEKINTQLA